MNEARQHFDRAWELAKQKDWERAEAEADEAVRLEPGNAEYRYRLGYVRYHGNLGDYGLSEFQEVVNVDPTNASAWGAAGDVYGFKLGRWQDAIPEYEKGIDLDPNSSGRHMFLGSALFNVGRREEAICAHRKAISLNPVNAEAHHRLGYSLYHAGDANEALAEFEEAVRLNPRLPNSHIGIGDIYCYYLGHWQDSIEPYRRAIAIAPNRAHTHLLLGIALSKTGRPDEAEAEFREAIRLDPKSADAHHHLAISYVQKGEFDPALIELEEVIRLEPNNAYALGDLGGIYYRMKSWDKAVVAYGEAARIDTRSAGRKANFGQALYLAGRQEEAITQYIAEIETNPNYADAHHLYGDAHYDKEDFDQSAKEWTEAVRLGYNDFHIFMDLGIYHGRKGDWDEAIKYYKQAQTLRPDDYKAHYYSGQVYYQRDDGVSAMAEFEKATQIDPLDSNAYIDIAAVYLGWKKYGKAISNLLRAAKLNGRRGKARAAKIYENLLATYPDNRLALCRLGWIYASQRRYTDATRWYEKALSIDPNNPMARIGPAYVLGQKAQKSRSRADYEAAKAAFECLLAEDRSLNYAYWSLAELERTFTSKARAISVLDECLKWNPNQPETLTMKVKMQFLSGRWFAAAKTSRESFVAGMARMKRESVVAPEPPSRRTRKQSPI